MALVAGIDSSTQSCKVVIRDAETGRLVREGRAQHPEGPEVHPDAWWDALQSAIGQAGGFAGVGAGSVAGQRHGRGAPKRRAKWFVRPCCGTTRVPGRRQPT